MTKTKNQDTEMQKKSRRSWLMVGGVILLLVLLLFIICLILAFTVFKVKQPKIDVVSATLVGITPRISFPLMNIELNISLNISLLVHNRNYATFEHGDSKSYLLYHDKQIGETDLPPGNVPSRGSEQIACRLTVEVDNLESNLTDMMKDIVAGELVTETVTRIPGKVTFLGIIEKHVIATSECRFTLAFPAMEIQNKECKTKTKL